MNGATVLGRPSVLGVISAMITPAILILATGSLVASTLSRIARVFDRARDLLARTVAARERGDELAVRTFTRWLRAYRRRTMLAERALTFYYGAIFLFVVASLSIALEDVTRFAAPALSLGLVMFGAALLCLATAFLFVETSLATGMLRAEIAHALGDDWHSALDDEGPGESARASTIVG